MKSLKLTIALMLVTSFSAACGGNAATGNGNQPASKNAPTAQTINANEPLKSAAAGEPATPDSAATLYQSIGCAMCHGADGKGNATMKDIPNFTDAAWQKKTDDAAMINVIKNGKPPMPAYQKRLTDEQIKAMAAYVRSLAK